MRVLYETKVWNHNRPPDVVWCIAGSSYPELFVNIGLEGLRNQMDQNYWSAAYMAQAALKEWLKPRESTNWQEDDGNLLPGPRHLIFTSSVLAFYSMVGYAPYAPTKAALRSLSDGLAQEVQLYSGARRHNANKGPVTDVKIHTVFPGTFFSPGYEQENLTKPAITKKLEEADKGQTEEEVAAISVRGLERGEYLVTTSFLGSLMRACSWGGSPRNSWVLDSVLSWILSIAWFFVQRDLDGKVFKWGQKYGYPEPRA
ncbi:MAG: 3-dehydrosphinganine reductase [Phylliscum demangeonii]|nr:MAG: 3-dehydrosphinganine reductase [Phylliscum demangeonii]